jgi:RNA polymerase-binding transcription factor DksA
LAGNELDKEFIEQQRGRLLDRKAELERMQRDAHEVGQELKDVSRALEKIEEGTYGLSDGSGEQIPKGRLKAIPEALYTIEEQQRREGERRPPV